MTKIDNVLQWTECEEITNATCRAPVMPNDRPSWRMNELVVQMKHCHAQQESFRVESQPANMKWLPSVCMNRDLANCSGMLAAGLEEGNLFFIGPTIGLRGLAYKLRSGAGCS